MKKIFLYCLNKGWIISTIIFALAVYFNEDWLWLLFCLFLLLTSIFKYRTKKKKRYLIPAFTVIFICILTVWNILYPSKDDFTNRKNIQRITGVNIPKFKVINSRLVHEQLFDTEYEFLTKIEFESLPDNIFFNKLDAMPSWHKKGDVYSYSYGIDDKYFCLKITKGSKIAEITDGKF